MSDLIIVAFDTEEAAFSARTELLRMQKEYLIELDDAVVVTRETEGGVKLHQASNLVAAGATGGTFWGALIGLVFLNPVIGALAGAGAGALTGALSDIGIEDGFLKDVGHILKRREAALAVLVRKVTGDKLLLELERLGARGKVLQTSLSLEKEALLRAVLESNATGDGASLKALRAD